MNLLRIALLLLLLLTPWEAEQAATRAPSVILTVQVAPANACTPMGQAGQDVMAAGFTTTALCNDFTTPIPNTVGTGLPSNWLDCNLDAGTSAVWYWGFSLFQNTSEVLPCAGHVDWNVVDPVYGNYALRFTFNSSELSSTDFAVDMVGMQTANFAGATNPVPGPGQYPYAYYEWTWRTDNPNPPGGGPLALNNALWSWVSNNANTLAGQFNYRVELDFTETGYWSNGDMAWQNWGPNRQDIPWLLNTNAGQPTTSYHTWGVLFTGDGGSNFGACLYVDGVRQGCNHTAYLSTNEQFQRRYMMMWLQCGDTSGTCTANNSFGTAHQYITNVKVLTCANWQQSSASGMCAGSILNNRGFYR